MILKEKYVPRHLTNIYFKAKKIYRKYNGQGIFDNNLENLDDFIRDNNADFFQNIVWCGFFFDKKIIDFLIDNQYSFNNKDTFNNLYFSILTNNIKLFSYIVKNEKIDNNLYTKLSHFINRDFSFSYAIILLDLNVDFNLKENFFLQACYYGKAKTVEYMLNEFDFSEDIINDGVNKTVEQQKTGTFNKIFKHSKVNININENLIKLVVNTKDYRIIKKIYEHRNFEKHKYSLYLFELLFNNYRKMGDYISTERYYQFMRELFFSGLSLDLPKSVVDAFLNNKFKIVQDFFDNRNKIKNF